MAIFKSSMTSPIDNPGRLETELNFNGQLFYIKH